MLHNIHIHNFSVLHHQLLCRPLYAGLCVCACTCLCVHMYVESVHMHVHMWSCIHAHREIRNQN